MNTSASKGTFKCSHCDSAFSKFDRLTTHESKHTGERPFACDVPGCTKTYTNKAHLKRHKCLSHQPKVSEGIQCTECAQVLSNIYSYRKHFKNFHENQDYCCTHCKATFKKKHILQEHVSLHTGETRFKCEECNICFGKNYLYRKHMRNHKTYTCDCGEVFGRWTVILKHQKTCCIAKKEHKCIICGKTFASASILKQHSINVHLPESQKEMHKCEYPNCSRSYQYKRNLTFHINTFHKKLENPVLKIVFICDQCNVILKSKKNLKQHMRAIHSNFPKKIRRDRKDIGKPIKSMASLLSGMEVPHKQNMEIIKGLKVENTENNLKKVEINLRQDVVPLLDKLKASQSTNKQSFRITEGICNIENSGAESVEDTVYECEVEIKEDHEVSTKIVVTSAESIMKNKIDPLLTECDEILNKLIQSIETAKVEGQENKYNNNMLVKVM